MEILDTVREILQRKGGGEVWSVSPETTVYQAIEIMAEKRIGALLVLEDGKLRMDLVPGRWMDNAAHVVTENPMALGTRHHVAV